jgi:hypothetical protein
VYSLCWQYAGRAFESVQHKYLHELTAHAQQIDTSGSESVWIRCTPMRPVVEGRGLAEDSVALMGLIADLDVRGVGHSSDRLPDSEREALLLITKAELPPPSRLVRTGGGLSAWWKFEVPLLITDEDSLGKAAELSERWQRRLIDSHPNTKIDNVGDLSRVMRLPGTTNRKQGSARACVVLGEAPGPSYVVADITALLDRLGVVAKPAVESKPEWIPKDRDEALQTVKKMLNKFVSSTTSGNGRGDYLAGLALAVGHGVGTYWPKDEMVEYLKQAAQLNGFARECTEDGRGVEYAWRQIERGIAAGMKNPWPSAASLLTAVENQTAPPEPRLQMVKASSVQLRRVRWTWAGRIPAGEFVALAGREGQGKSSIAALLAGRLTKGTLPGAYEGQPKGVIIVATEDSWSHTVAPRLRAARADMDKVFFVSAGQSGPIKLPLDLVELEFMVKEVDAAMVVLDPLASAIDGTIDSYRDNEMRTALEPLRAMLDRHGAFALGLVHFGKAAGRDALNSILGSRAISATARAVLACAKIPDDDGFVLSQVKNNLGRLDLPHLSYTIESVYVEVEGQEEPVGAIVFGEESATGVEEIMAGHGDKDAVLRSAAAEFILEYLAAQGGEAISRDVYATGVREGHSRPMMQRAMLESRIQQQRLAFGGDMLWRLPSAEPRDSSSPVEEPAPADEVIDVASMIDLLP